jgi:hypothetical protein
VCFQRVHDSCWSCLKQLENKVSLWCARVPDSESLTMCVAFRRTSANPVSGIAWHFGFLVVKLGQGTAAVGSKLLSNEPHHDSVFRAGLNGPPLHNSKLAKPTHPTTPSCWGCGVVTRDNLEDNLKTCSTVELCRVRLFNITFI